MMSNKIVWIKTKYVTVIMGISIVDILFYKLKIEMKGDYNVKKKIDEKIAEAKKK